MLALSYRTRLLMRNGIDIDPEHSRAIVQEIGKRLRTKKIQNYRGTLERKSTVSRSSTFGWMNCTGFVFPSQVMMEDGRSQSSGLRSPRPRIGCALPKSRSLSKYSNQNEKPDLGQQSSGHDRDRKEHVARRERTHECLAYREAHRVNRCVGGVRRQRAEGLCRSGALQAVVQRKRGGPQAASTINRSGDYRHM